ncbi:adenylyltransferase/sulfurtransferase [Salegentibacter sp. 24]|uniref:HesA/MoeB/ThiF family protein n=1 Tax=Salegentibacter sp. 24 TaxID=2183986 RepID=UPI001060BDC8|nr:HesA/MoeB/ThiF family protein [Salegentibacter sp. 24]TDN86358.1 adenylyltransferase/sulfurtransferase [Salegentibacter sp. 24]
MQRYKKQIGLPQVGENGQEKLKNSKVLVIGVGGLGCAVLPYLAAAGIGKLGLVDGDRVDESNLQRQVLFREKTVGKFKVTEARKQLLALNSEVKIENYQEFLNGENALQLIKNYDLVVDCTDSLAVRYLINDACVLSGKAFVYASVYKFEFQVSVFNFKSGPTYRCLFPDEKAEVQNCEDAGVLGTTVGLSGMFQATEILKIIMDAGEVLSGKLLMYNTLFNRQDIFEFSKIEDLKIDNDFYNRQYIQPFSEEISAEEINENAIFLDVREGYEQPKIAFPRMLEIPLRNLENELCLLNPEEEIQVICQSGKRSLAAVKILKAYNFKNVKSISGGVIALHKLNEVVETT